MIGETILHYKIIEKLGEGGMGVVYKAEDTRLKRQVAIKFLPHHIAVNKEERQRFEIEAQAAAALNHPNIATIYAIEDSNNEVFIAMEYINGVELKDKIKDSVLPIDESIKIVGQIAEGLHAAHSKGITHRDIKTSNIMITPTGQIKIMDFGLAKVRGVSNITVMGTTLGTTSYMSPEQARGEQVDHRTDVWSLGVIFFEILTGKLPHSGEYDQAIIYSILNEEPKSPMNIRKEVPLKLEQVVMKLLTKDKNRRYQNLSDFLEELHSLKSQNKNANNNEEKKTIAVLPFENISPDKEADYFADGLAEELITSLSKIKEIKLVARTNAMRYKGTDKDIKTIGRELGAGYIMQGSVRKFNDDLRISVQMMDVVHESQLWGETYKGKLADVFDIQEKVAKEVADALRLNLSLTEKVVLTKRSTINPDAFDCYLRAKELLYQRSKRSMLQSIKLFQKATELDPRYAEAYAGLGEAYSYLYFDTERNIEWLDLAIEYGLKALMYDSSLSEAYASLANSYASKGQYEDAVAASYKAIELDPNNFLGYWILGRILVNHDKFSEAAEKFKKVIELNPDFYSVYGDLQIVYSQLGQKEKCAEVVQTALVVYERYLLKHPYDARCYMFYATDLAQIGKHDEAKIQASKALQLSPDDPLMLYNATCFYSQMGEKNLAIESLKKAISVGYANFEWLKRDADLDPIRNENEFIELIEGK